MQTIGSRNNTLLNDQCVIDVVKEEIKSSLEVNENESMTYQNLSGRSQIKDQLLHLKLLEKQEQTKPKTSRRKEIIKIRA
jgi:hypothetical protein